MQHDSTKGLIIFDHDGTLIDTHTQDFKVFPGIKELLMSLRNSGFEIAIWTARSHRGVVESLKKNGLTSYVGEIYGHDDGPSKPHPYGLESLSSGFSKDKIIHIGDSMGDLTGASYFGIKVIAACWFSKELEENYSKYTPFIAKSVDECKEIIANQFN